MKLLLIIAAAAALYAPNGAFAADSESKLNAVKSPTDAITQKHTLCDNEGKGLRGLRSAACSSSPQAKGLRTNMETETKGLRTTECAFGEMFVEVDIFTDQFPEEISWEVYDRFSGQTYMSGGSYTVANEYTIVEGACVPDTCDIVFAIYDTYGDGLRSLDWPTYEDGYYNVFVNFEYDFPLITSHSNGDFLQEHRSFCPLPGVF